MGATAAVGAAYVQSRQARKDARSNLTHARLQRVLTLRRTTRDVVELIIFGAARVNGPNFDLGEHRERFLELEAQMRDAADQLLHDGLYLPSRGNQAMKGERGNLHAGAVHYGEFLRTVDSAERAIADIANGAQHGPNPDLRQPRARRNMAAKLWNQRNSVIMRVLDHADTAYRSR